jgi:hypothetical protein
MGLDNLQYLASCTHSIEATHQQHIQAQGTGIQNQQPRMTADKASCRDSTTVEDNITSRQGTSDADTMHTQSLVQAANNQQFCALQTSNTMHTSFTGALPLHKVGTGMGYHCNDFELGTYPRAVTDLKRFSFAHAGVDHRHGADAELVGFHHGITETEKYRGNLQSQYDAGGAADARTADDNTHGQTKYHSTSDAERQIHSAVMPSWNSKSWEATATSLQDTSNSFMGTRFSGFGIESPQGHVTSPHETHQYVSSLDYIQQESIVHVNGLPQDNNHLYALHTQINHQARPEVMSLDTSSVNEEAQQHIPLPREVLAMQNGILHSGCSARKHLQHAVHNVGNEVNSGLLPYGFTAGST